MGPVGAGAHQKKGDSTYGILASNVSRLLPSKGQKKGDTTDGILASNVSILLPKCLGILPGGIHSSSGQFIYRDK